MELLINKKINKDIIIIGSSRGARDIIASQIENETGQTAYNLSYDASAIEFHEFILRTLVKFNKTPKTILLVIDDNSELLSDNPIKYRFDRLYPLVKYSYIRNELINRGEKNKHLSDLFVLHQLDKSNFNLKRKKFTPVDTIMSCGSMPLWFHNENRRWKFISDPITSVEDQDPTKIVAFKNFVKICEQYNIKLILVFPPNFKPLNTSCLNTLMNVVKKRASIFTYDINNPVYKDKMYFYDEFHLLHKGAEIFTHEISLYINNLINKVDYNKPNSQ